jgi:hypothetical protein
VVEDVFTRRGRRAKRISYAHVHGYGKNHEDVNEKPRNLNEENKEKTEIRYYGCNVNLEVPAKRPRVHSRKFDIEIKKQNVNPDNRVLSSAEVSAITTDEANEILLPGKPVSAVCISTECLENENSEVVDDPSAIPKEVETENSNCSEQQKNIIIHSADDFEKETKVEKGKYIM